MYAAQELASTQQKVIKALETKRYWREEAARQADATERRMRRRMSLQGRRAFAIVAAVARQRVSPRVEPYVSPPVRTFSR